LGLLDRQQTQALIGIVLRLILIVFALIGTHHLFRMIQTPPTYNDLYPVWLGSRELFVNHRNPYGDEISRAIQTAFYGAPLGPGDHPNQECCFAYPVYVSFLFAPIVNNDFAQVLRAALVLLVLATAISVICWSDACWRTVGRNDVCWHDAVRRPALCLLWTIPLVLVSPPVAQGLDFRQPALLVAALLSAAAVLAKRHQFALAGITLALATIKPQMSLLPIAWMLFWAARGWAARKNLIVGFAAAMAILIAAGEYVLPGWISSFAAQISLYRHFAGASMLELLYGRHVGLALDAALICGLILVIWRKRAEPNFVPTLAFILAIEVFVVPGLKSLLNLVLLMPGIFLLLAKYPVMPERFSAQRPPQAPL
jgi:hypothetical protein